MSRATLGGVCCPLVTPFRDGAVDREALSEHVDWLVASGIDGLVPCGTTGEFASLTDHERETVVRVVARAAPEDVPVVAGTADATVPGAVDRIEAAIDRGADAALVPPPFFHGPNEPTGVTRFYERILSQTDADIVLYNIPGCVGYELPPETIAALAPRPQVLGLKDSSGDFGYGLRAIETFGADGNVLVGPDRYLTAGVLLGAAGGVNGLANALPTVLSEIHEAAERTELERARRLDAECLGPLHDAVGGNGYAPTIKTALALRGRFPSDDVRPPLVSLSETARADVRAALESIPQVDPA
jgi:4-hydroxy-tetrahydrodipicolinate synthase